MFDRVSEFENQPQGRPQPSIEHKILSCGSKPLSNSYRTLITTECASAVTVLRQLNKIIKIGTHDL